MLKIRAKFRCDTVIPATEDYDAVAYLSAVYSDPNGEVNEENKSFSDATPSGQLTISISKEVPAHKYFRQGRHYYLDFTRIPMTEEEKEQKKNWDNYNKEKK